MARFAWPILSRRWLWQVPVKIFSTNSTCFYEILGVTPTATQTEIRKAFVDLSKKYHPDVTSSPDGHKKFVRINEAYSVLSRPSTRRDYDFRRGLSRSQGGNFVHNTDPGRSDEMYQQWYRSIYRKRKHWKPQDDFGEAPAPTNESMRKAVKIITVLLALTLVFQAFILSRNQERQHQRLVEERQRWILEVQSKMKPKSKEGKGKQEKAEEDTSAKESEEEKEEKK